MTPSANGAELRFELPDVASGTVVGTVEVIADRPETRTAAVVTNGVPERVPLPATLGYSVQGRLTSGERLSGYAPVDGRVGRDIWVPLQLNAVSDGPPIALHATRFPDAPWAAGWTWDIQTRCFVSGQWLSSRDQAAGTVLTSGLLKCTNLAQVSPAGGPACFVLQPAETPLWVVGDRVEPEPGLAATLLDCLRRADLLAARAVANKALSIRDSIEASSRILLDLTLGYYLLDAEDDRLADWAAQLANNYDWSADAHVISAHALLRRRGDHGQEIAKRLETALVSGLPVITRGLQLLNDILDLAPDREEAARRAVLPYAVCARPDTVLTTFWGESPDAPKGAPILGEQPSHAVVLTAGEGQTARGGPIAASVEALLQPLRMMPASTRVVITQLHQALEESLRLASRLSLAQTTTEVVRLAPALMKALRHAERPATVLSARLARAGATGRRVGSASKQDHDRKAFGHVSEALRKAGLGLRAKAGAVDRAGSLEYARIQAVGNAAAYAARLAVDVREAVTALRETPVDGAATSWTAAVEGTTAHAVEA
ncbi:hypothetical protein ACH4MW_36820 [Streptomyces luteogriseus]|uniref:hypothetical protein n=1 Tax=Streptomyces luteogriseus TaxID=68233 RepID=UPI0037B78BE8